MAITMTAVLAPSGSDMRIRASEECVVADELGEGLALEEQGEQTLLDLLAQLLGFHEGRRASGIAARNRFELASQGNIVKHAHKSVICNKCPPSGICSAICQKRFSHPLGGRHAQPRFEKRPHLCDF